MLREQRGTSAVNVGLALLAAALVGIAGFAALATFGPHEASRSTPVPSVTVSEQKGIPRANEADDAATQSDLRNALVAAKTYFTDRNSYAGFDPVVANSIEPSLRFNTSGAAVVGEVSIRAVSENAVLLVERSPSGTVFCLADNLNANYTGTTSYGKVDAASVDACRGAW